jgi:hypothetical protein
MPIIFDIFIFFLNPGLNSSLKEPSMFKRPLPKPLLLLEPPLYGSIKIIGSGECLDKFPALHAPIMVHVNHFHEAMQPSNASSSISGCCPDTLVDLTSSIPLPILPNPFHQGSMLTHEGCGLQFRVHQSLESLYLLP